MVATSTPAITPMLVTARWYDRNQVARSPVRALINGARLAEAAAPTRAVSIDTSTSGQNERTTTNPAVATAPSSNVPMCTARGPRRSAACPTTGPATSPIAAPTVRPAPTVPADMPMMRVRYRELLNIMPPPTVTAKTDPASARCGPVGGNTRRSRARPGVSTAGAAVMPGRTGRRSSSGPATAGAPTPSAVHR